MGEDAAYLCTDVSAYMSTPETEILDHNFVLIIEVSF
jgi:hypothetical protein